MVSGANFRFVLAPYLMPDIINLRFLQLIATEPKLQISTIKTKYLASSYFQIVNVSELG